LVHTNASIHAKRQVLRPSQPTWAVSLPVGSYHLLTLSPFIIIITQGFKLILILPTVEGRRLSRPMLLATDGLPTCRWSPIQLKTRFVIIVIHWSRPTHYH